MIARECDVERVLPLDSPLNSWLKEQVTVSCDAYNRWRESLQDNRAPIDVAQLIQMIRAPACDNDPLLMTVGSVGQNTRRARQAVVVAAAALPVQQRLRRERRQRRQRREFLQ